MIVVQGSKRFLRAAVQCWASQQNQVDEQHCEEGQEVGPTAAAAQPGSG